MSVNSENNKILTFMIWAAITCVILSLYILTPFASYHFVKSEFFDHKLIEKMGQIGDTFGAFSALITSISVLVLAISFYYQRKSFDLQRHELELQRQDIQNQSHIFLEQVKQDRLNNSITILFAIIDKINSQISNLTARKNRIYARRDQDSEYIGSDALLQHRDRITEYAKGIAVPDNSIQHLKNLINIYYPILRDITTASKIAGGNEYLEEILLSSMPKGLREIYVGLMNVGYNYEQRQDLIKRFEELPQWLRDNLK